MEDVNNNNYNLRVLPDQRKVSQVLMGNPEVENGYNSTLLLVLYQISSDTRIDI